MPDPPRPDQVPQLRSAIRKCPNSSGSTTLRPRPVCLPFTASGKGAQGNGRQGGGGARSSAAACAGRRGWSGGPDAFSGGRDLDGMAQGTLGRPSLERGANRGPRVASSSLSRLPWTQDRAPRCRTGVQGAPPRSHTSARPHHAASSTGQLGGQPGTVTLLSWVWNFKGHQKTQESR